MGKGTPLLLFWEKSPLQKLKMMPTLLWPLLGLSPAMSSLEAAGSHLMAVGLWDAVGDEKQPP